MKVLQAAATILITTLLVSMLAAWGWSTLGFRSMPFACLVNLLALDWVAVTSIALGENVRFHLPSRYHEVKKLEENGSIYSVLLVHLFKKLVSRRPLALLSPSLRFSGNRDDLDGLERETRYAETAHVVIFGIIAVPIVYALINGWLDAAGWLFLFSVVINVYPIMVQRYNRIRILRLVRLRDAPRP